jgi:hypothetical protein
MRILDLSTTGDRSCTIKVALAGRNTGLDVWSTGNRLAPSAAMPGLAIPVRAVMFAALIIFLATLGAGCAGSPTGADSATTPGPSQDPATATSLTYSADVQPLLNNDCLPCHGGSNVSGGVSLSGYTNVMRTVTAGNPNSILILVSQPGGLMYANWRGSAAAKAETLRRWVVDFKAAQ